MHGGKARPPAGAGARNAPGEEPNSKHHAANASHQVSAVDRALTIAGFTLLEAFRTRMPWLVLAIIVLLLGGSLFFQGLAITESLRFQIGFLAATLRPATVFVLSLYVISSMAREFNDRSTELILSLDLPRGAYLLGKFAGFSALATFAAGLSGAVLAFMAPAFPVLLWTLSLVCELWIAVAVSLFCVVTFNHILPSASFVLGFYLLGRSITTLQLISGSTLLDSSPGHKALTWGLDAVALLIPRLDSFTQTAWLVDHTGSWSTLAAILAQTAIYTALLLAAALVDLYRKNF